MPDWRITNDEWDLLEKLLLGSEDGPKGPGRPRGQNTRQAAEACLYRHFHSLSPRYPCFGWNNLPEEIGVSPSTANRRYREWVASGAWERFWQALLQARHGHATAPWEVERTTDRFPTGDINAELERAYCFFNAYFFGGTLPQNLAILLTQAGRRTLKGFYCPRLWTDGTRWAGQIAIATPALADGPEAALATLLHEMVHLRNDQAGITDCHGKSQYHNRHFRDMAHLSGLTCAPRHRRLGYGLTALNERGQRAVAGFRPDRTAFRWKPVV